MACPTPVSRVALALAGALLLGSGSGWTQPSPVGGEGRPARAQPVLDALVRLTPAQRREYVQAQRTLEENRSRQRLAQLDALQRCLVPASTPPAIRRCMQAMNQAAQQLRAQRMEQQQAIAQRFGIPLPRGQAGRHHGPDH